MGNSWPVSKTGTELYNTGSSNKLLTYTCVQWKCRTAELVLGVAATHDDGRCMHSSVLITDSDASLVHTVQLVVYFTLQSSNNQFHCYALNLPYVGNIIFKSIISTIFIHSLHIVQYLYSCCCILYGVDPPLPCCA